MPSETYFRHDPLGGIVATRGGKVLAVAARRKAPQDLSQGLYSIRRVGRDAETLVADAVQAKQLIRRMK